MAEIVLEEDDCLKLVVEADPGDVRVCFREKESGPYGWFETSACWHEVEHIEKALSLVRRRPVITAMSNLGGKKKG